jgi:hypothetical protein
LRSSEVYLDEILLHAASTARADENKFVDDILRAAWVGGGFAAERERAQRLAVQYGLPPLREANLAEINQRGEDLAAFLDGVEAQAKTWATALGDLNQARLDAFLTARPNLAARLALPAVRKTGPEKRRALTVELLDELVPATNSDDKQLARVKRLIDATADFDEIAYRAEVRMAALLRLRTLVLDVAGRFYLQNKPQESAAFAALERCEDLGFTLAPAVESYSAAKPALRAIETDRQAAERGQPAWAGLVFAPISSARRQRLGLADGAVRVVAVVANSPASRAGLRPGDLLLGAAGEPFTSQNPIRPAVGLAPIGAEWPLDVQRGSMKLVLRLRPQAAPQKN